MKTLPGEITENILKVFGNTRPSNIKSKLLSISKSPILDIIPLDIEEIKDSQSLAFKKELNIFEIKPPKDIKKFYSSFANLEFFICENFKISKMILSRGKDLSFYAYRKKSKFVLFKGFEENEFENWSKFFTRIIELSLIPEIIFVKNGKLNRYSKEKINKELLETLTSLYLETESNPENVKSIDLSNSIKSEEYGAEINPYSTITEKLNNSESSPKPENIYSTVRNNPEKPKYEKLWKCKKCETQNNLNQPECKKCFEVNNSLKQNLKFKNMILCLSCNQPSLNKKCRQCLSSSNSSRQMNHEISKTPAVSSNIQKKDSNFTPSTENSEEKGNYSTVQSKNLPKEVNALEKNSYSTVQPIRPSSASEEKKSGNIGNSKPQNFNQKVRSSSMKFAEKNNKEPVKGTEKVKNIQNHGGYDTLSRGRPSSKDDTSIKKKQCEVCKKYCEVDLCNECMTKGCWKCDKCKFINTRSINVCEHCNYLISKT
jgi:hypothetical protein